MAILKEKFDLDSHEDNDSEIVYRQFTDKDGHAFEWTVRCAKSQQTDSYFYEYEQLQAEERARAIAASNKISLAEYLDNELKTKRYLNAIVPEVELYLQGETCMVSIEAYFMVGDIYYYSGCHCPICGRVLSDDHWYVGILKRAICENCFDELDKLDRDGRAITTSPFAPTEPFDNCYYCHNGDGLCLNCRNKAIENENHKEDEKSDNTKLEETNTELQMPRWFMHIRDNDIKKHCDGCHTIISSQVSYLLKGALNTIVLCPTCFDNVLDDNKPSTEIITKIIANSCQNNPVIGGCPLHEDDPLACLVCEWQNEVPETKLENDGSTPPCGLTSYDCQNINSAGRLEDQDICTRCNRRFVNTGFGKCKGCGRELSLDADGLCSECHFWNEYYPDTTYGKCNKCRQENTLKDGLCLKCQRNEMAIVINPQPKPTITIEELDSEILVPTEDEITEIEDTPIEMPETPEIEPQPEGDSVENRARGDLSDLGDKKVSIVTKSEKRALKAKSDNLTKPRKPTEHALIVETLYEVFGWSLENIEYGGRIGKVAKWLRSHDVIASDIAGYVQWLKEFYKKQGYNNGEITIGSLNQVENLEKYRKYLSEQKPLITETIEDELGPNDPLEGIRVHGVDYAL